MQKIIYFVEWVARAADANVRSNRLHNILVFYRMQLTAFHKNVFEIIPQAFISRRIHLHRTPRQALNYDDFQFLHGRTCNCV